MSLFNITGKQIPKMSSFQNSSFQGVFFPKPLPQGHEPCKQQQQQQRQQQQQQQQQQPKKNLQNFTTVTTLHPSHSHLSQCIHSLSCYFHWCTRQWHWTNPLVVPAWLSGQLNTSVAQGFRSQGAFVRVGPMVSISDGMSWG